MQTIKCPNCGASAKNNASFCLYCGTSFVASKQEKTLTNVKPVILASAIENSISVPGPGGNAIVKHSNILASVFVVVFFVIWCGTTFWMGINMQGPLLFSLVPFFMCGVGALMGVVVVVGMVTQIKRGRLLEKYLAHVKKHQFDEAFEIGKKLTSVLLCQALIAFYHKKEYDLAEEYVLQINSRHFLFATDASPLIENMYKYFGYDMPKK